MRITFDEELYDNPNELFICNPRESGKSYYVKTLGDIISAVIDYLRECQTITYYTFK